MIRPSRLLLCIAGLLVTSCANHGAAAYFLSHHPDDHQSRPLRHYPVARQGNLTAWLSSDHVNPAGGWLYSPGNTSQKFPIVGIIGASSMPEASAHDGSFLIASGYDGPIFDLWEGTDAEGRLFVGQDTWIPVQIHQNEGVNTWIKVSRPHTIGGWSGFPVVIGDPNHPDSIAGAMWYKSNTHPKLGGATSTRMLKRWLGRLRFADFVRS